MSGLYVAILELSERGIIELRNEKLDLTREQYTIEGFQFKILCEHGDFIQLLVYVSNSYTTQLLNASVDNCGLRYGIKYDTPVLFETDGGFSGVVCDYIFQISKKRIEKSQMYQKIGINDTWKLTPETYSQLIQLFHRTERITGFNEMIHYIETDKTIYNATLKMVQQTMVYDEKFVSNKNVRKDGNVRFQENLTLIAAESFINSGKHVAVLNFANPVEEGGGVLRGAKAQEEYLCRSSNLYYSLVSENANAYYTANRKISENNQFNSMFLGTDKVIYSPDVIVLKKTKEYYPFSITDYLEKYCDCQYSLDVLTCAAPFFSGSGYILPNGDLMHLFERRIRNIFEVCIENDVEVLILGAFGCGAFHNPPDIVADAFRNVLLEKRYINAFDEVVFAVKRSECICSNIEAFERNFSAFPNINYDGNEKKHRLSWKWVCSCGVENHWDNLQCANCSKHRRYYKKVVMYNRS